MPNWCQNTLFVSGDKKSLDIFRERAKGRVQSYNSFRGDEWPAFEQVRLHALISTPPDGGEVSEISFHRLYPVPAATRAAPYDPGTLKRVFDALGFVKSQHPVAGYNWESNNWGVKWGARDVVVSHGDGTLSYDFNTPWGPPVGLLHKVAKDYPTLSFYLSYNEPGMGAEGEYSFSLGALQEEGHWDMESEE